MKRAAAPIPHAPRHTGRILRAAAIVLLAGTVLHVPPVAAQEGESNNFSGKQEKAEKAPEELQNIESEIDRSKERTEALEAEARSLAAEMTKLSRRLVATASRVHAREAQISTTEKRLTDLSGQEKGLRDRLVSRRGILSDLLAGLQRLERNPPPAIAVKPAAALDAVRSAMLLGVIVPELRVEANALVQDLSRLKTVRTTILREKRYLSQNLVSLEAEQKDVRELLDAKNAASKLNSAEIKAERERIEKLAQKAKSLKDLIAQIETEKAKRKKDETKTQKVVARATALVRPTVRFSRAKGLLAYPAQGTRIREFGAEDGYGSTSKGLSIATREKAQVTAPCDGWVVYAGPFRSYGQLLIINAGEGYHVLLAGMRKIDVVTDQFVRAGEPVGLMGEQAVDGAVVGSVAGDDRPVLYVEFRRKDRSIDPGPWWAGNDEKVRG